MNNYLRIGLLACAISLIPSCSTNDTLLSLKSKLQAASEAAPTTERAREPMRMFAHQPTVPAAATTPSIAVTLAFDPSLSSNVIKYKLHWGTATGTYQNSMDLGLAQVGTITDLQPGTLYFFVATAWDSNGISSVPSNEVSYQTAADQPYIRIIVETSPKPKGPWTPVITNTVPADSVEQYFRAKVQPVQ